MVEAIQQPHPPQPDPAERVTIVTHTGATYRVAPAALPNIVRALGPVQLMFPNFNNS